MTISYPQKLSALQRDILIGTLLGDSHLETQTAGKTYRLCFSQSSKKPLYIAHMCTIWSRFIPPGGYTTRMYKDGKTTSGFRTRYSKVFVPYAQAFYCERVKIIPSHLEDILTARGLAYWYMDDGSIKSKESKGVLLNTQSFSYQDITYLCEILHHKFKLHAWPRVQNQGTCYQIYISGKSYEILRELITPYFTEDMWYKFPLPRVKKK